jgi:hypothetical protein
MARRGLRLSRQRDHGGGRAAGRRELLALLGAASAALVTRRAHAFGEEGSFNPRVLLTGTSTWTGVRGSAPARWSLEVQNRTSAPARLVPTAVRPDDAGLLAEPFAIWAGSEAVEVLTSREVQGLARFIALGGVLFVDDSAPERLVFTESVRRELRRAIPDGKPIPVGSENVVFRTFYLLDRAYGRVDGSDKLDVIVRGGLPQVLFSKHDLLGALARGTSGVSALDVVPGGEAQRERAIRLAVNIAMYVLCSNYKDDQVHAENLMRRRGAAR